jgi:hypothetical protein
MRTFKSPPISRPLHRWANVLLRTGALSILLIGPASSQNAPTGPQWSDVEARNIESYSRLIRADLRKEKRSAIGDSVGLDAASKDKFWAVYDRYEKEYKALWDVRLANTQKYAEKYADSKEPMSDAAADSLARGFLANDARMAELRSKYYAEFKAAVGARLAARFLHAESVFDRMIELQILAVVPMIP